MNIRFITVIVFVIIILGGLGFFFMNEKNTKELSDRINTSEQVQPTIAEESQTIESSDKRVQFRYPSKWIVTDTTNKSVRGKFGKILQAWTMQNTQVVSSASGSLPENLATIDITIQDGGSNLAIDSLLDCSMKTITCDKIGINNEQFIKSDTVLNTGVRRAAVATFYDNNILMAQAVITPGMDMDLLTKTVESVFNSFTFVEVAPTNP